jgi:small subunit ribosomal protein S29
VFTDGLIKAVSTNGVDVVDVPTYSPLEVDHILSNFEVTGIGRLRFDRGETVMDNQEVAFLRILSCGVGQKLLDACIT